MKSPKQHPSQVQVSFSRCSNSGALPFYGSDIKCSSFIKLTVKTSELDRSLSQDRFYGKDRILEIHLSPNQFTEMITNLNVGDGTPGTLKYFNPVNLPVGQIENPVMVDKQEIIEHEINEISDKTFKHLHILADKIQGLKISEKKQKELLSLLQQVKQEIKLNLPYVLGCAKEQVSKTIVAAKSVIESYYLSVVTRLGQKALQEQNEVQLLENKKED